MAVSVLSVLLLLFRKVHHLLVVIALVQQVSTSCPPVPACETCYREPGDWKDEQTTPWIYECPNAAQLTKGVICHDFQHLRVPVSHLDLRHYNFRETNLCTTLEHSLKFCNFPTSAIKSIDLSYSRFMYKCSTELFGFLYSVMNSVEVLRLHSLTYLLPVLPIEAASASLRFTRLRELDLSSNDYTEKSVERGIGNHKWDSLEVLNFDDNNAQGIPKEFRPLPLKHLSMANNQIQMSIASSDVNRTQATIDSLKYLPRTLESLDLSGNTINFFPSALAQFSQLKTLRLSAVKLSRRIDIASADGLEHLEFLDLSGNLLSQVTLGNFLHDLHDLKVLNLSKNFFDSWPLDLDHLPELRQLHLQHNTLTTLMPFALQSCDKLSHLDVSNNKILIISEPGFHGIEKSLQVLRLNNNKIRTLDKCTFKRLSALRQLTVSGNPLHCDCSLAWIQHVSQKSIFTVFDISKAICHSPIRFKGMAIGDFPTDECSKEELAFEGCPRVDSVPPNYSNQAGNGTSPNFEDPWHIVVTVSLIMAAINSILVFVIFTCNRRQRRSVTALLSGEEALTENPYTSLKRMSKLSAKPTDKPAKGYTGLKWGVRESAPSQQTAPKVACNKMAPPYTVTFQKGPESDEYEDTTYTKPAAGGATAQIQHAPMKIEQAIGHGLKGDANMGAAMQAEPRPSADDYISFDKSGQQGDTYCDAGEPEAYYNTGKKKAYIQPIIYDDSKG
ncbi:leucine-rich repeat neuronal protein 3 [Lingula anatina]|uniref:Leucine-rich repeat neuronal protein 3 n=1 Tax=Lingula anatina TaxID=7574 RepID=A0A1S3JAW5_LINAN|nr:leucine-rich repeat neuronal protein 3 [Lingula anatina]|eukprot:XP_013407024.1 leucine-rich repeat neuronal protein 3 [Lingula anatina]